MDDRRDHLAGLTTLALGGPAGRLVTAGDPDEIVKAIRTAEPPLLVLAGGSNVVIADEGFPGTVVLVRTTGVVATPVGEDVIELRLAAGEPWDRVVDRAVAEGWSGIEALSGIPGSAGATPIQNVGAYGQEVADVLAAVRVYDRRADRHLVLRAAQCDFGYRTSRFRHHDRYVVLEVTLRLARTPLSAAVRYGELATALGVPLGGRARLDEVRAAVLALRSGKGMVLDPADPDTRSAGSFFTNPVLDVASYAQLRGLAGSAGEPAAWPQSDGTVKVSAAWLIERAGFARGCRRGAVGISGKHTLALTNRGGGTTAELLDLARQIRDGVRDRFGVTLHPEPVLVNCAL